MYYELVSEDVESSTRKSRVSPVPLFSFDAVLSYDLFSKQKNHRKPLINQNQFQPKVIFTPHPRTTATMGQSQSSHTQDIHKSSSLKKNLPGSVRGRKSVENLNKPAPHRLHFVAPEGRVPDFDDTSVDHSSLQGDDDFHLFHHDYHNIATSLEELEEVTETDSDSDLEGEEGKSYRSITCFDWNLLMCLFTRRG